MTDQRKHGYTPDTRLATDWRGLRPCTCGLPRTNRVHDIPETHPDAEEISARILGEGTE